MTLLTLKWSGFQRCLGISWDKTCIETLCLYYVCVFRIVFVICVCAWMSSGVYIYLCDTCSLLCHLKSWSQTHSEWYHLKWKTVRTSIPLCCSNSFSCTSQQGSLLHFTSYKIHPLLLFFRMSALNRKLLYADTEINLARNGEKVHFSSGYIFRVTQLFHALIFLLFFLVLLLSLSLFLSFFLFLPHPPSFFKSLGSLWCHSMRHHSSGATLYCCIVVLLPFVAQRMSPSPAVFYKQQAGNIQRSRKQREKDGGCCF